MRIGKSAAAIFCMLTLLTGCMPASPEVTEQIDPETIELVQLEAPRDGQETAVVETTAGTVTLLLYPELAPQTVTHFKKLVKEGFYENLPIFLQDGIDAFVSGATNENGSEGKVETVDGKLLPNEATPNLWHFSGAVSVLGADKDGWFSDKMLGDSRFFILGDIPYTEDIVEQMKGYGYPDVVIDAYKSRGGKLEFTGKCTVFGQVIEGMDVVNEIIKKGINADNGQVVDGTKIVSITLSTYQAPAGASSAPESTNSEVTE